MATKFDKPIIPAGAKILVVYAAGRDRRDS